MVYMICSAFLLTRWTRIRVQGSFTSEKKRAPLAQAIATSRLLTYNESNYCVQIKGLVFYGYRGNIYTASITRRCMAELNGSAGAATGYSRSRTGRATRRI